MSPLPPPSILTKSTFEAARSLYPSLVSKVYASRIKDPKKVDEAVERDEWRFVHLLTTVDELKANDGKAKPGGLGVKGASDVQGEGLSKAALERLVQWKINHGQFRPFLPGMVRKNNDSAIVTQTSLAFQKLASAAGKPPSKECVREALNLACKLTGIGPATGTLILNIYDPDNIPFFQDEMFAWFFPKLKDGKLKYDQKEYFQLFEAVEPVLKRLGVKAVDLEKVSYVLAHIHLLDDEDIKSLQLTSNNAKPAKSLEAGKDENTSDAAPPTKKGTKRRAETKEIDTTADEPKRRTRRKKA